MRTVLILLALIVVVGVGLGWFHFSSRNDKGEPSVTLSVDKDKITTDKDKLVNKVQDLGHQAADKIAPTTQKARD